MKILIINGPNLNMLGKREEEHYGQWTLKDLEKSLKEEFKNCHFDFFQSNIEGEIVSKIHEVCDDNYDGLIINAGAYTHTSIAIADALKILNIPIVEVHISNIYKREEFRHKSFIAPVAIGQISGFGKYSYFLAVRSLLYLKCSF